MLGIFETEGVGELNATLNQPWKEMAPKSGTGQGTLFPAEVWIFKPG